MDINLLNVKATVLGKVIEFCQHYKQEEMTPIQTPLRSSKLEDLVQDWYAKFVDVDRILLFDLVTAANFMDIKPLLDLTCLAVATNIKVSLIVRSSDSSIVDTYMCDSGGQCYPQPRQDLPFSHVSLLCVFPPPLFRTRVLP